MTWKQQLDQSFPKSKPSYHLRHHSSRERADPGKTGLKKFLTGSSAIQMLGDEEASVCVQGDCFALIRRCSYEVGFILNVISGWVMHRGLCSKLQNKIYGAQHLSLPGREGERSCLEISQHPQLAKGTQQSTAS